MRLLSTQVIDVLDWLRFGATVVTPFAVLWLGIRSATRKRLMESIDTKLEGLKEKVEAGRGECREDVRAISVQFSAFQREVASEYPRRAEIGEGLKEIREELRDIRNSDRRNRDWKER